MTVACVPTAREASGSTALTGVLAVILEYTGSASTSWCIRGGEVI